MQRGRRHKKSKKNPYYISEYRLYELIYFCLQYPEWKREVITYKYKFDTDEFSDPTGDEAVRHVMCMKNMELVERCAKKAGGEISEYIFKAVTEDLSFVTLNTKYCMPCGRDRYYQIRDKFFYLLSQEKQGI